jgi:hypothetical protein
MLSCTLLPCRYGPFIKPEGMHNRLKWTAIGKQGHDYCYLLFLCTESFKECAFSRAERLSTAMTLVTWAFATVNTNVARLHLASCRTRLIRAKWEGRVHWLWCTGFHKHIMPRTVNFFKLLPFHQLAGSYLYTVDGVYVVIAHWCSPTLTISSIVHNALHYCRVVFLEMLPHFYKLLLAQLMRE